MPTSQADQRAQSALLRLDGVSAGYGPVPVISNIDATVCPQEIVAIVGPNGAGKSTLLKTVLGVLAPVEGTITLDGNEISGRRTDRIARLGVGYVPQVRDVFDTLTVRENLEMGGYRLKHRELAARIEEMLVLYPQLAEMRSRYAGHLSGGERKMLAMGRVLMARPSLLVLDEPTAGLSPQLAHELLHSHVTRLARSMGVAILLVEQHAREALAIADWAYLMVSGEITLGEPAADLLARPDIGEIFLGSSAQRSEAGAAFDEDGRGAPAVGASDWATGGSADTSVPTS
jgi:branched-chain amino acid transport system ATP-binding protein